MEYSTIPEPESEYSQSEYRLGTMSRMVTLIGGIASIGFGATRRSWPARAPWLLVGGLCLYQGVAGINLPNRLMGIRKGQNIRNEGFVVERVMTINRPIEDVYAFWKGFENYPTFMGHLVDVQDLGEGRSHWIAKGPLGIRVEWIAQMVQDLQNQRIAWKSIPDSQLENDGIVEFSPAPGNRGTEIKIRIVYQPPAGSAGIMLSKLFGSQPSMVVLEDLRRFKQIMEAGEIPTTKGQPSGRVKEQI